MRARDVMISPVVTAGPDATVGDIVRLMLDHRISAVPIVDAQNRPLGLISEGDLMRRSEIGTERHRSWWLTAFSGAVSLAEDFVKSHGVKASEVMTKDVVSVSEDAELWEIAELLEKRKIRRVPVLRKGKIVGIVSRSNLLQAMTAGRDKVGEPPTTDDRTIRETLLRVLSDAKWSDMSHLNVVVRDGTVHFWGLVSSQAQREALEVAAEEIPGVHGVVDHTLIATSLLED